MLGFGLGLTHIFRVVAEVVGGLFRADSTNDTVDTTLSTADQS